MKKKKKLKIINFHCKYCCWTSRWPLKVLEAIMDMLKKRMVGKKIMEIIYKIYKYSKAKMKYMNKTIIIQI